MATLTYATGDPRRRDRQSPLNLRSARRSLYHKSCATRTLRMKVKKRLVLLACFALVVGGIWLARAHLVLAVAPWLERKGESGGQWLRDTLIACGPAAVKPAISSIRSHSPWVRNYGYLPGVLRHFGEPAHQELLVAIDSEGDPHVRAYLTSALQTGFHDFNRFDRWLGDRSPDAAYQWSVIHMASQIRLAFPDAPDLESPQSPQGINPYFLSWWNSRRAK